MTTRGRPSFIDEIRGATRASHAALDGAMAIDSGITVHRYAAFLRGSLAAVEQVEAALAAKVGLPAVRRRADCLRADLLALGEVGFAALHQDMSLDEVHLDGEARCMGALYVMEGSSLGGVALARTIGAALHLDQEALGYLRFYGAAVGENWRACVVRLNTWGARAGEAARREACATAGEVFGLYAQALHTAGALSSRVDRADAHALNSGVESP